MTITSISTTGTAIGSTQRRQPPAPPAMTQTAALLGTSADELSDATSKGTSLTKLAAAKGVSTDDLLASIKADLKASKPADAPELSDDQLTVFAGKVAEASGPKGPHGPGGPGGHGGPPPAGGPPPSGGAKSTEDTDTNLSTLADALGTDKDSLLDMLTSVKDLGALLEKSGVTGYGSAGKGTATSSLAVDTYA